MALKEKIIKCFNSKAYTYQNAADMQPQVAARLADRFASVSAKNVLEIGCGTGFLSQHLLHSFPDAQLLLTDIAPAMVDITRDRFQKNANVFVKAMDGEALETSTQFDLIVSSMTLHWFTNFKHSLQQIIEKLTPGGQLVFAMLGKNSLLEWRNIFQEVAIVAPTPAFPDHQKLAQHFPELKIEVEVSEQRYRNTHEFLKTLKAIGAHAAQAKHVVLSSGRLRRLMQRLDRVSPDGVNISYEVVYGSYTKS
ncbi:MAG: methyltransferase [Gammaproteobacteria bacterium]|nr:methyltransferase [Gammaproteobacteria bacterium]